MKTLIKFSFILFLSLYPINYIFCQEISDVKGETFVEANVGYLYTVELGSGLSQYTEFEIRTNYGKFDSANGSNSKSTGSSVGTRSFSFTVYWPNNCFSDGFIVVYKKGEAAKTFELKAIRKKSCESSNTNDDSHVQGPPTTVFSGEEFSIGEKSFEPITDAVEFTYDSNLFEKISTNKGKITLKPKQVIGKVNTSITMKSRLFFTKYKYTWTFDIYGTPHIVENSYVICPGNKSFEIKNYFSPYFGYSSTNATWQGIENLTLVSGQNSNNPIFKANNGVGGIKATVTWRGNDLSEKTFNIEHTYWIGSPKKITYINGINNNQIFAPNNTYTLTINSESQFGTTKLNWYSYDDRIKIEPFTNGNIYGAYLKISPIYSSTPFSIRVVPENSCGKGQEFIVWGATTPNGLRSASENDITPILNLEDTKIKSVKVYSMAGIVIYSNNSVDLNFNYKDLNIQSGVYILEKISDNGSITHEKIVISR